MNLITKIPYGHIMVRLDSHVSHTMYMRSSIVAV